MAHEALLRQRLAREDFVARHRLPQTEHRQRDQPGDDQVGIGDADDLVDGCGIVCPGAGDDAQHHRSDQAADQQQNRRGSDQPGLRAPPGEVAHHAPGGSRSQQRVNRQPDAEQHADRVNQHQHGDAKQRERRHDLQVDRLIVSRERVGEKQQQPQRDSQRHVERVPQPMPPPQRRIVRLPEADVPQHRGVPGERQRDHGAQPQIPPDVHHTAQRGQAERQNGRVTDEERAACQQTYADQPDAPRAALGVEQHGEAEPEQQDGVGQRDGDHRPRREEGDGRHGCHAVGLPCSSSTEGVPSSAQVISRPSRTISAARVRATFSSTVVSFKPQTA